MGQHCSSSPHHDHCQPASCLYPARPCRHGDASASRCIYSSTADEEDSDTPRRRGRAKPLLAAADTDTQTDGESDERPPDDAALATSECPLATQRLLVTSSDQLPVTSNVIAICRATELIVA